MNPLPRRLTMRVGIDVSILSNCLTGIGRFTVSLIRSLAGMHEDAEWVLLGLPSVIDGLPDRPNIVTHRTPGLTGVRRVAWQQIALPRLASRYGVDVLHCPDFSRPIRMSGPVVNTIHDLSYYSSRPFFSFASRNYKRALTHVAARKSSWIVADSMFTRDELIRNFKLDGRKISVVYLGTDPMPQSEVSQEKHPFILYVGTLEERKNLITLIEGFTLARAQNDIPHRLILAGKPGHGFDKIQTAIRNCPCKSAIEAPGYIHREKLFQLYRGADALVFPSFYEGFGLPVLEAMSLGTPVICSRAASLPEVGGDAVEYFDPLSAEDIARALRKVLKSPELRSEMRRKGIERAARFSWEECARRYYEIYQNAAAQRGSGPQPKV